MSTPDPLAEENKKKCYSLIHGLFSTAAGYKLDFDNKSGHILVKTARFWSFEFEFPTIKDGPWYAQVYFMADGSLSAKKSKGWLVEGKTPDQLRNNLFEHLDKVAKYTEDLLYLDVTPDPPPPPPPSSLPQVQVQADKVVNALRDKPELMWQVAHTLAALKLASPWTQKIEVDEEEEWVDVEDVDETGASTALMKKTTQETRAVWRRQALGWEGPATVATVSRDGSRWMVHWAGCKAAIPNPNLEHAMEFADRMLRQDGWTCL